MTEPELPEDPDTDAVPSDLRLLAGLDSGQVVLISEDGAGPASLAISPPMFAHARRLCEGWEPEEPEDD